jgi:hypothetical protein
VVVGKGWWWWGWGVVVVVGGEHAQWERVVGEEAPLYTWVIPFATSITCKQYYTAARVLECGLGCNTSLNYLTTREGVGDDRGLGKVNPIAPPLGLLSITISL